MKKTSKLNFTIILLAICFVNIGNVNAKVWRVNNNPGVNADFSTLQTAHDAANAGDTLYIEGSATSYGDLTVLKKLVIIGTGYCLSDNPKTQYNRYPSTCGTFTFGFTTNSIGSITATSIGSTIIGCSTNIQVNVTNISIIKCKFSSINYYWGWSAIPAISSGLISQCFGGNIAAYPYANYDWKSYASNIIITNNILGSIYINSSLIVNNVLDGLANGNTGSSDHNVLKNNIFTSTTYTYGVSNNQFTYNIFEMQQSASIIDATNKYAMIEDVFVCYGSACNALKAEARYQLKAGSPAIAAGENGVDCGAFGNYQVSGIPSNMPAIYDINANPTTQDILNVTVKVKSH